MNIKKIILFPMAIISINGFLEGRNQIDNVNKSIDDFNKVQEKQSIKKEMINLQNNSKIIENKIEKTIENNNNIKNNENIEVYLFSKIELTGEEKLSSPQKNIIKKYENKNITKTDILNLLKEMSNYYLKKGYITTIVTIKESDLEKKILILEVKKGYIEKFYNNAFPNKKNSPLNIFDIDQGIENINTGLTKTTVNIVASEKEGYSILNIQKNREKELKGYIFLNNSQYKDYGREQVGLQLTRDNILGLSDILTLGFYKRLTNKSKDNIGDTYFLSYNVPFGYYNFKYDLNLSKNKNLIEGINGNYTNKNDIFKQKFTVSKIFYRNQNSKFSGNIGIKYDNVKSTFENLTVEVNNKKYTNLFAQLNYFHKIKNGVIYTSFGYERGLKWFGSSGDDKEGVKNPYKKEFDKYSIDFILNKNILISEKKYINYKLNLEGSYSEDRLLSRNKFEMGSENTVRGFKESSVAGDKGIYINNTITLLNKEISPFIGLDFGISKDKDLDFYDKIIGGAIGLNYNKNNLDMNLTFSLPIKRSKNMPKESNPIYYTISYSF